MLDVFCLGAQTEYLRHRSFGKLTPKNGDIRTNKNGTQSQYANGKWVQQNKGGKNSPNALDEIVVSASRVEKSVAPADATAVKMPDLNNRPSVKSEDTWWDTYNKWSKRNIDDQINKPDFTPPFRTKNMSGITHQADGDAPNQGNHMSSEHGHIETYKGPLLGVMVYGMNKFSPNFSSDFEKIPLYVEQLKKIFESGETTIENFKNIGKTATGEYNDVGSTAIKQVTNDTVYGWVKEKTSSSYFVRGIIKQDGKPIDTVDYLPLNKMKK